MNIEISDDQPWCIYALSDPETEEIRYVGFTCNLKSRMDKHLAASKGYHTDLYCHRWIRTLLAKNLQPKVGILHRGIGKGWEEVEKHWIQYLREKGCKLTNLTSGGDGTAGRVVSEELRNRLAQQLIKGRSIRWQKAVNHSKQSELLKKVWQTHREHFTEGIRRRAQRPENMVAWRSVVTGVANNNAKMTPESVRAVRAAYTQDRSWKTVKDQALQYGVYASTIRQIILRRTWKDVD